MHHTRRLAALALVLALCSDAVSRATAQGGSGMGMAGTGMAGMGMANSGPAMTAGARMCPTLPAAPASAKKFNLTAAKFASKVRRWAAVASVLRQPSCAL